MSVEKAKANYMPKGAQKKMSCGQSVISAFKDKFSLDDSVIASFAAYGGGKAPGGVCGAYYAAQYILNLKNKDKAKECEDVLVSHAGSLKCKEIRQLKRLPCIGCVEKMAEILEKL